jgi:hypothetical protein
MKEFINKLVEYILDFREIAGNVLVPALPVIQWVAVIFSGILIWLIIYLGVKSNWFVKRVEDWIDKSGVGSVGKWRQLRAWKHIIMRVRTKDPTQLKLAIMEADLVMDEVLKESGYRQDTTDERYKELNTAVLSNADKIKEAHKVRNRCAQEPDFAISYDDALEVLKVYKVAFQEYGLLD